MRSTFYNSEIQFSSWVFLSTLRNKAAWGHPHSTYAQNGEGCSAKSIHLHTRVEGVLPSMNVCNTTE